jgi:argininosuccinate lyase
MAEKLWGGRFQRPAAAAFERFSESFSYDRRLAAAELRGSLAWAGVLHRYGVLSAEEHNQLSAALRALLAEVRRNGLPAAAMAEMTPAAPAGNVSPGGPKASAMGSEAAVAIEDVHTWVFQEVERRAGAAARKLQTARSRNEQVSLDLRLYLLDERPRLFSAFAAALESLAGFAEAHAGALIPGYTHLQRAQPVSLGHWALAHAEMLLRDTERLADAYKRIDVLPLGSGALAGSTLPLNREALARHLGFSGVSRNSLDAVADRDFCAEFVFVLALAGVHLSRLAEDYILYSSSEFGFFIPGDEYATGSSLMPQKKNPDAMELVRGRSARQIGRLTQLLTLLKGLPLSYNRDLQEDKEAVFEALDTAAASLHIAAGVIATTEVNRTRAAAAAGDPALLATDLADLLVAAGVPFRSAHEAVGRIVSECAATDTDFRQLPAARLQALVDDAAGANLKSRSPGSASPTAGSAKSKSRTAAKLPAAKRPATMSPAAPPAAEPGTAAPLDIEKIRGLSASASVNRRDVIGGTAIARVNERAVEIRAAATALRRQYPAPE